MGTPLFMAPEQCMGREVDARTDIYALGVILYRMFAGRFPFQGTVITELVFKHMTEVPTPPSLHRQMPPDLERIILDCLAKDPVARPQSARLLADRLSAALDAWPAIAVGVATGTSALTDSTVPPPVAVLASTPVLTRPSQTTLSSPSLRPGRFLTTVPDRLCDLRVRRNADWSTSTHSAACDTSKYELPAAEKQACKARIDRANSMQDDAKRMKWIGWGTAGVGGAVFLTGVILRLLADDVDDIRVAGAGHLQPYAWTSPAGGGLGLHGNF
jgi:serine/threonine protein kinase